MCSFFLYVSPAAPKAEVLLAEPSTFSNIGDGMQISRPKSMEQDYSPNEILKDKLTIANAVRRSIAHTLIHSIDDLS